MVEEADGAYEVTLGVLMRRRRPKFCERVVADALHARGYWFRKLRNKMILTPTDVQLRYDFAKAYRHKPKAWWLKHIHLHVDNHHFKVATTAAGRRLLAKRRVRGVYRTRAKSLKSGHVKPDPKLRIQTGPKGILKMGGVGGGKVLVWQTVKGRWSGDTAAKMYKDVVKRSLSKRYLKRKFHTILEDNDPTGNQSKRGILAKRENKLRVFSIPPRSPDLNVLDYAVWSEVEKRMRRMERMFSPTKHETRSQFERRLDRTALSLPSTFINKSIANMRQRVQRLYKAKGGLFEEGGRAKRPL